MKQNLIFLASMLMFTISCEAQTKKKKTENSQTNLKETTMDSLQNEEAIFGAGCFWCVEAIFQRVPGVVKIESGYSGGTTENPTYKEVCTGATGHAEVIKLSYDAKQVSYETLLSVFWQTHDPTTLNRQGGDEGTQYRSAVFYKNEAQKESAERLKAELDKSGAFTNPIVTEISPLINYYPAEDYHQNYYNQNSEQSYCQFVIAPKLEKFEKVFGEQFRKK
jgi:peptide-methionine (S)-S-oxide reductase